MANLKHINNRQNGNEDNRVSIPNFNKDQLQANFVSLRLYLKVWCLDFPSLLHSLHLATSSLLRLSLFSLRASVVSDCL